MHSSCHLLLFLPLCLLLDSFLFILLLGFGLSKYSLCALYSHYTKGDRRGERTLCVCVCVRTVLLEMSTPIRCYCSVGKKKVSSSFLFFWPVRIGPARSVAQFGFPRLGFLHGICPTTFGCFREKSQHKCSREIVVMWSHAPPLWPNNFHLLRQKGKPSLYSQSSHLGDFLDSFLFVSFVISLLVIFELLFYLFGFRPSCRCVPIITRTLSLFPFCQRIGGSIATTTTRQLGGSPTYRRSGRIQRCRYRHGSQRVLHVCRVGYFGSAGCQVRNVFSSVTPSTKKKKRSRNLETNVTILLSV